MNEEAFETERSPGKNTLRCFLRSVPWITVGNTLLIIGLPLAFFLYLILKAPVLFSQHDFQLIARTELISANTNGNTTGIVNTISYYMPESISYLSITELNDSIVPNSEPHAFDSGEFLAEDINGQNNHTFIPIDTLGKSSLIDSFWIHTSVLMSGSPVEGAQVSAIARDRYGNGFAANSAMTGTDGHADLGPIPERIGGYEQSGVVLVSVRARYSAPGDGLEEDQVILNLEARKSPVTITVTFMECLAVIMVFFISIILALYKVREELLKRIKYIMIVILTIMLSCGIIMLFFQGAKVVHEKEMETGSTTISMGFIHIFKGNYLPHDNQDVWIVSLTPQQSDAEGLGAPLWVILVSVVGAVLTAIGKIIENIKTQFDSDKDGTEYLMSERYQANSAELVLYQLFILFSPIGAIFLYQSMLLSGTANENFTVGIVALAAGASLSLLLRKALKMLPEILSK